MKTIKVSNEVYKRLEKYKVSIHCKTYSKVIRELIDFYGEF